MIPIFQEREPNYLKAHLLWPFSKRYRNRVDLKKIPMPLRLIAVEVLVINEPNILLVKNSKAGCTSAAHMFYQCFQGGSFQGDIHRPDIGLIQGESHLKQVRAALLDREYFKITTVRHPVPRAISSFTDFFVDRKNWRSGQHEDAIRYFGFNADASEVENFDAYLRMLDFSFEKDRLRTDRHFRPQVVNTCVPDIKYDAICKVEDLGNSIKTALHQAGVPQNSVDRISIETRNQSQAQKYRPNAEQIATIGKLYQDDLDAFGYDLLNF